MTATYPPNQPEKAKPVSLEEAASLLANKAVDLEAYEKARVAAGWVALPDPARMREAQVLFAAAKVLDLIQPKWDQIKRLIAPKQAAPRPGGDSR